MRFDATRPAFHPVPLMNRRTIRATALVCFPFLVTLSLSGNGENMSHHTTDVPIAEGWSRNSINAVIFRSRAVATHGDSQYVTFYNPESEAIVARRQLGSVEWEVHNTGVTGNTRDAHNAIAHAIDGSGVLHFSWDHHGHDLNYAQGRSAGSLDLTGRLPMTGENERSVTYPEFFNLVDGDLLFMYRVGGSGSGRIMLNRFDNETREWSVVQHPLIDGTAPPPDVRGRRTISGRPSPPVRTGPVNSYTNQIAIDSENRWHLSWTWRETGDVATNHNICYAVSPDEGETWYNSAGEKYELPITYETAEIVAEIPRNSELINQTSMTVDSRGRPHIVTYWRPAGSEVPQFHLVWNDGESWRVNRISRRTVPFRLSGGGTRRIPVSRPKVAIDRDDRVFVLYRDEERGAVISVAVSTDLRREEWTHYDLTADPVDMWEPNYDKQMWARENRFHIFKQRVGQGQRETLEDLDPTPVSILEWDPASMALR